MLLWVLEAWNQSIIWEVPAQWLTMAKVLRLAQLEKRIVNLCCQVENGPRSSVMSQRIVKFKSSYGYHQDMYTVDAMQCHSGV